ncbi:MAG: hypothetical protein M3Y53_13045 [Thermoproteota archaeon]|nr:hypothetical protein [Thermoproteota archaeon]
MTSFLSSGIATTTDWFWCFMTRAYVFASQYLSFPTVIVWDIVFILFKEIVYKNYSYPTSADK